MIATKQKKILIVDDNELVCASLGEELRSEGYEIDAALIGFDAIAKANENKYDVVLLDLVMPEMNGIEVCKEIKTVSPETTVVFMTGHVNADTIQRELAFQEAGGEVYHLYKPFSDGEVLKVIDTIINKNIY